MQKLFLFLTLFASAPVMAQKAMPLYSGNIPNSIASPDEEKDLKDGWVRYSAVSRPTLTVYLPPREKANGTAVVICPGGGYSVVAYRHEGDAVAAELVKVGVAAFVLKYRIPNDKTMIDKSIGPLQDAQQAIMLVRQNAKQWNVDTGKVGILGFSAGGHLASTAGTHYEKSLIDNPGKINLRPDFMILVYPVISFTDSIGHLGSRENLLGKSPSAENIKFYSGEFQVNAQTPPSFMVHAGDDEVVKVENSLHFYEALKRHGVSGELIVVPKGGHGFGLINPTTPDRWMDRCKDWMKSNGWLH
jgi:acetyl esterase/lipase